MKKVNQNQNAELVNATVNTENQENNENKLGGKKIMKNLFKENRAKEQEMKEAAAKELARQERLDAIEPIDIIGTMDEVNNNTCRCVYDEEGNVIGINGGKLYQEPIFMPDGRQEVIAAETPEKLEELKKNIAAGLSGDGMFHKIVYVNGRIGYCSGSTLEELEQDIIDAENEAKMHEKGDLVKDIDKATQLIDYEKSKGKKTIEEIKSNLEQINTNYNTYFIVYDEKCIKNSSGETIVELSDLKSNLEKEDVKNLLIERLNKWEEENAVNDDYEDDEWDDENDYDEDNDDEWEDEE